MRLLLCQGLALVCLIAVGCTSSGNWPPSSDDLVEQLRCGMTKSDVERISGLALQPVTSTTFRGVYGTHTLEKDAATVWLTFDTRGLESVARWRPEQWKLKAVYMSPKENLCTGKLSFFLRVYRPECNSQASAFVDGTELEAYRWGDPLELATGLHEIRVKCGNRQDIVIPLSFREGDRGNHILAVEEYEAASSQRP